MSLHCATVIRQRPKPWIGYADAAATTIGWELQIIAVVDDYFGAVGTAGVVGNNGCFERGCAAIIVNPAANHRHVANNGAALDGKNRARHIVFQAAAVIGNGVAADGAVGDRQVARVERAAAIYTRIGQKRTALDSHRASIVKACAAAFGGAITAKCGLVNR